MYLILIWLMLKEGIAVCSLLSNFPYRADSFSATTTLPLQATNKCVFNELLIDSLTQKGCVGSCVPALPTALPAPSPDYERTQEEDREITYYSSLSWHAPTLAFFTSCQALLILSEDESRYSCSPAACTLSLVMERRRRSVWNCWLCS